MKKSSSIGPEKPEKTIISAFKSYLVHSGSFKRIFFIFVQALSRKFEVIEENVRVHCCSVCFIVCASLRNH